MVASVSSVYLGTMRTGEPSSVLAVHPACTGAHRTRSVYYYADEQHTVVPYREERISSREGKGFEEMLDLYGKRASLYPTLYWFCLGHRTFSRPVCSIVVGHTLISKESGFLW